MNNPIQTPETVRSGRHANFFILENSIVDDWAGVLGPISIAVYCCLWRHADRADSTFIGTSKLAVKLKLSPRAMQRALKTLADHKLIRIVRTARPVRRTVFHMLPVPSPAKGPSPMPLFDSVPDSASSPDAQSGANRRRKAGDCTGARVGGLATAQSRGGDCTGAALLMEQDPFNKRGEQKPPSRVDDQNGKPPEDVPDLARKVIKFLSLTKTSPVILAIEAAIPAEADFRGCSNVEASEAIAHAALDDRRQGIAINSWYFVETKWRPRIKSAATVPLSSGYVSPSELNRREAAAVGVGR
jgi:hypothetical protein